MSKTPICDRWEYDTNQGGLVVPLNVAKDLETELAEARADLRLAKNIIQMHVERVAERDKLIEQMREALSDADDLIDEYAADYEHRDNVDEIRDEIKAALSAAERMGK